MNKDEREPTPTIVGGQPVGKQGGGTGLPHGIEAIVLLAAAEPAFRQDFARNRRTALSRAGIRLSNTEQIILDTVRDKDLFAMAERAAATPRVGKRGVLATAVSLAALASLTTGPRSSKAESPDGPASRPALGQLDARAEAPGQTGLSIPGEISPTPTEDTRGIRPDSPTPTHPASFGIQPDTPTPTPTEESVFGIRPDTPTVTPTNTPVPPTATSTVTHTPPPIDGIRPDTPTPTYPPVAGILTETPTPTETATYPVVGILTETPTPTETPAATETPNADLDGDGKVDHKDLMLFMKQWYADRGEKPASEE